MDEQPLRRKWVPTDENALRSAFAEGLLEERNWCDLKMLVGPTRGATKNLAIDLASFAIHGGTIIIGLDERAPDGNPLHPVELADLAERVEQIAGARVHPPLLIDCTPIQAGPLAPRGTGYLVVHIPASPLAPHQVDGVYYGRGDKTNRRLIDPEVERLFQRRATWNSGIQDSLDSLLSFRGADQVTSMPQVYIAARPIAAWPDLCLPISGNATSQLVLGELRRALSADQGLRTALDAMFNPHWQTVIGSMSTTERTPTGIRLTAREPGAEPGQREWDVDLDIDDNGTLWFSAASVGLLDRTYHGTTHTGLRIDAIATYVLEVLTFANLLSRELSYASVWEFGVALTNLHGCRPIASVPTARAHALGAFGTGYEASGYRRSTRADVAELARKPGVVLDRLIGQLARTMYADNYLKPLTDARQ